MEGRGFGGAPRELEVQLSVQDFRDSAGVVMAAVRYAKLGLEWGLAGPLEAASDYYMKSPQQQLHNDYAQRAFGTFMADGREGRGREGCASE